MCLVRTTYLTLARRDPAVLASRVVPPVPQRQKP